MFNELSNVFESPHFLPLGINTKENVPSVASNSVKELHKWIASCCANHIEKLKGLDSLIHDTFLIDVITDTEELYYCDLNYLCFAYSL